MSWKRRTPAANRRRRRRLERDSAYVAALIKSKGVALAERLLSLQLAWQKPFPHRCKPLRGSVERRRQRRELYQDRELERIYRAQFC